MTAMTRDKMATVVDGAPAIVWLSYNVHGNVLASSETAMLTLFAMVDPSNAETKEYLDVEAADTAMYIHFKKEISFNAYAFNDASPASGINYYRLRQMGNDSTAVYSETIALQFSKRLSLKTYPNPAAHYVTVEGLPGTTPVALTLINIDGKLLAGKTVTGNTATFDIGNLPPGAYYVVIQTAQTKETMKFVKAG